MRPLHMIVSDLERASMRGELTPTFIDRYASRHGEKVPALYALATKHAIVVNIEDGRNDHLLAEWGSTVNEDAVARAMDRQAVDAYRRMRASRGDDRPSVLRRKPGRFAGYVAKPAPAPAPAAAAHRCPPGCTCDLDKRPSTR
ncbi:hypothetical protein [Kineococcus glutinatus]|uniref:EthD domain-containing protein n=1 Tax=Kineococcus glutinatus TaxID=1070872 RepID=A0ABP9H8S4_9ACTN